MNPRAAAAVLAAALLGGCASSPTLLTDSAKAKSAYAPYALLDDVPFHPQREYQCGPAALASALNAAGVDVSADLLVPAVYVPARRGSLQPEMLAASRRHGRVAYRIDGSLDALFAEVDSGHPVVVLQNLGLAWLPVWHYAVVIGYDVERRRVVLHSGTTERATMGVARFDRTWARSGRWAMVALRPEQLPAGVDGHRLLEAIHAFETTAGAAAAAPAWIALTDARPDHALAWFARGNAHYARRELLEARDAFEIAVVLEPELGPGWINLGYLYNELGEVPNALFALRTAVAIEGPWRVAAEAALDRLERTSTL